MARKVGKKVLGAYIKRQLKDEYCIERREHGYRARSAFKLIQIDDKARILKPGSVALDVGAAPGSWTQVCVERIRPAHTNGLVVAIDRQPMALIEGAVVLAERDALATATHDVVRDTLRGRYIDCLLSDMAPSPTGDAPTDHVRIVSLVRSLVDLACDPNGPMPLSSEASFLCKIWDGPERKVLMSHLLSLFSTVKIMKPLASRDSSAEVYLLARFPL